MRDPALELLAYCACRVGDEERARTECMRETDGKGDDRGPMPLV